MRDGGVIVIPPSKILSGKMEMIKINHLSSGLLAALLLLTAWGNAYAFFVFGVAASCAGMTLLRGRADKSYLIAVIAASVVSVAAGLMTFFTK